MDVAQLIVQQLVNERGVNDEWHATVNMAFQIVRRWQQARGCNAAGMRYPKQAPCLQG